MNIRNKLVEWKISNRITIFPKWSFEKMKEFCKGHKDWCRKQEQRHKLIISKMRENISDILDITSPARKYFEWIYGSILNHVNVKKAWKTKVRKKQHIKDNNISICQRN